MEYGLIGEKLGHSFSKEIHDSIGKYEYEIKEVSREDLAGFILKKQFKGLNVTIPYKEIVMQYLDYIDPFAEKVGAVNVIVNENGVLKGYNTDVPGLRDLIVTSDMKLMGKNVLILGTGGTSKTAYVVSKILGANKVVKLSRNTSDGKNIFTYQEGIVNFRHTCDYIINTTPCGMYPNNDDMPIDPGSFVNIKGVIDVIYNPLKTKLVSQAKKLGIKANGGLYMLVSQGVYSSELFLGEKNKSSITKKIYNDIYLNKCNIVLIGMPGSGKTSVGKVLAERLGKTFIDTDDEVTNATGITPSDYINQYGEREFRKIESDVISKASKATNAVIATGGGSILYTENIDKLKRNGRVYFLNRSLEKLVPTSDRPLSSTYEQLKSRYDERIKIYTSVCDSEVPGNGTVEETANKICNLFLMR